VKILLGREVVAGESHGDGGDTRGVNLRGMENQRREGEMDGLSL